MKRFVLFVSLMILAVTLAACGSDEEPTPVPTTPPAAVVDPPATAAAPVAAASGGDVALGQQTFATTCAACHGPAGEGVQGLGKDMTTSAFIAGLSDEELMEFVKVGRRIDDPLNTTKVDMPPKGGNPALTDEQLINIIAFIRSIHKS